MAGISSKAAGVMDNKKKYDSYELNTDFDINLYESFFRTHDPQIGRFWQLDPKSEKYYCLSSYTAMANNPSIIFDILGDDLELTGKKKDVQRALDLINKIFDGYYTASIVDGKVKVVANEKQGNSSKQADGLFTLMHGIEKNTKGTVSIGVVSNKPETDVDNWAQKKIDIADVEKFENGKYMSSASVLAHVFAEQESLQIDNKDDPNRGIAEYYRDHDKGEVAEGIITGYPRAAGEDPNSAANNLFGHTSGVYTFIFVEPVPNPEGKEKYKFHYVDVKFKNGNVKKVTSRD
jgi:RHS repeat-associated protein